MTYLTLAQKVKVMELTNEVGLVLFEFYMSKGGVPDYEYTDLKTAIALSWKVKKVADNRRALEKANLYKMERDKISTVYTIGEALMPKKKDPLKDPLK